MLFLPRAGIIGATAGEMILDSAALDEGGSYTAPAETDLLLWLGGGRNNSTNAALGFDAVTFGSVEMTPGKILLGGNQGRIAGAWYLKAGEIPTGSQQLDVDWTVTPDASLRGWIYALKGVDQTIPIWGTTEDESDAGGETLTLTANDPISWGEGDAAFTICTWRGDRTSDDPQARTGYTRDLLVHSDNHTRMAAHRLFTAPGSETPDWNRDDTSGLTATNAAVIWCVVKPAASPLGLLGLQGFGGAVTGGVGGTVIPVTNTNDSGAGSLRAAVADPADPKIIDIQTSGYIDLQSRINITGDNVTLTGRNAPGDGVCLRGGNNWNHHALTISGVNVLVEHLRIRRGTPSAGDFGDSLAIISPGPVAIRHCSISFATSNNLIAWVAKNISVEYCILYWPLHDNAHTAGPHGYNMLLGTTGGGPFADGGRISITRNILAHSLARGPTVGVGNIELVNNIMYNIPVCIQVGGTHADVQYPVNILDNIIVDGVEGRTTNPIFTTSNVAADSVHVSASNQYLALDGTVKTGWFLTGSSGTPGTRFTDDKWMLDPAVPTTVIPVSALPAHLLQYCGAYLPQRDELDELVLSHVAEALANTDQPGTLIDAVEENETYWDGEDFVPVPGTRHLGGWPELAGAPAADEVAFGHAAAVTQATQTATWSYTNHDLDADDDLILIIAVYQRSDFATGASYGGTAATFLGEYVQSNRRVSAFYMLKADLPSPGSGKSWEVTHGGTAAGFALCIALRGAAQSAPAQNGVGAGSATGLGPTSVTVGAGGAVVQGVIVDGLRESSIAAGSGEDLIFADELTSGSVNLTGLFSSKADQSGTPSMSVSWSDATNASHIVVGVSPPA